LEDRSHPKPMTEPPPLSRPFWLVGGALRARISQTTVEVTDFFTAAVGSKDTKNKAKFLTLDMAKNA